LCCLLLHPLEKTEKERGERNSVTHGDLAGKSGEGKGKKENAIASFT